MPLQVRLLIFMHIDFYALFNFEYEGHYSLATKACHNGDPQEAQRQMNNMPCFCFLFHTSGEFLNKIAQNSPRLITFSHHCIVSMRVA